MRLLDWFIRPIVKAAASIVTYGQLWYVDSGASPDIDQDTYAAAYRTNPWVQSAIERIGDAVASVPLKLYRGTGEQRVEIEDHPVLRLLRYVNARDDYDWLMRDTSGNRRCVGDAYWRLAGPTRNPAAIFPLRPARVKVKPQKDGTYKYEYRPGGGTTPLLLEQEEVVHFRRWNPLNDHYGQSSIAAIETTLNLDNRIRQFNHQFLKRGAVPSGMLTTEQELSAEQAKPYIDTWRAKYGGSANAGEIAVMGKALKYQPLGQSARDGMYIELAKMTRTEILAALNVPPVVVGILDESSYANADAQMEQFWRGCIIPELAQLCGTLNEQLLRRYGDDLQLEPDLDSVEALQEDANEQIQRLSLAVGVPFLSPNWARQQMGEDPDPDPAMDVVYASTSMMPLGYEPPPEPAPVIAPPGQEPPVAGAPAGEPTDAQEPPPTKSRALALPPAFRIRKGRLGVWGSDQHLAYIEKRDRRIVSIERQMRAAVGELQVGLLNEVLRKLDAEKGYKASIPTAESLLFDLREAGDAYVASLMPLEEAAVNAGAHHLLGELVSGVFDIENPLVREFLARKTLQVRTLPVTVHEQIRGIISDGLSTGANLVEVADQLQALEKGYEFASAERIARTETIGSSNAGSLEAMRQNDIRTKEWVSFIDSRTRSFDHGDEFDHADMNGVAVAIDDLFMVPGASKGLNAPGDPEGEAGNIINCRCTVVMGDE